MPTDTEDSMTTVAFGRAKRETMEMAERRWLALTVWSLWRVVGTAIR